MSRIDRFACAMIVVALQAGDLLTTWFGIHTPGIHEVDGTSFGTLLAVKLAVTAVCVGLLYLQPKAAWIIAGMMAVVYVPIIASNARLIWGT